MSYKVIVLAAGQGKRMQANKNKLFLELNHQPVLIYTLKVFEQHEECEGIYVAAHPNERNDVEALLNQYDIKKIDGILLGGAERQDSVYNVVHAIDYDGTILVHDGARPFIRKEKVEELVQEAKKSEAAILAVPVKDTVKRVESGKVVDTFDRSTLWAVQTPQAFCINLLREAHEHAKEISFLGTDDASLVEKLGTSVTVVHGDYENMKLTTPEDLFIGEMIVKKLSGIQ